MFRVMERIAETSYIKWIEFWLLFGTFVPFVQVILITIIEWLRNKEETEKKRQKESKGNVGLERSSELYEMSVGGKKVKVNNRLYPFYLLLSHTQVHPLITQVLPNDETRSKVKDFLTLGETSNILNNPSANIVLQDEGLSAFWWQSQLPATGSSGCSSIMTLFLLMNRAVSHSCSICCSM